MLKTPYLCMCASWIHKTVMLYFIKSAVSVRCLDNASSPWQLKVPIVYMFLSVFIAFVGINSISTILAYWYSPFKLERSEKSDYIFRVYTERKKRHSLMGCFKTWESLLLNAISSYGNNCLTQILPLSKGSFFLTPYLNYVKQSFASLSKRISSAQKSTSIISGFSDTCNSGQNIWDNKYNLSKIGSLLSVW